MADPSTPPQSSTQQAVVSPGGAGTLRAIGWHPSKEPKSDPNRVVKPDATGCYEADASTPGGNSLRILHLNQVGHALVGWFVAPPSFVNISPDDFPIQYAVLFAELDPSGSPPWSFSYRAAAAYEGWDPHKVLDPYAPFDPGQPPEGIHTGTIDIQVASNQGGWDGLSPRLTATLTFAFADGTMSRPLRCVQTSDNARPSERIIDAQSQDSLKRALTARYHRPIPSTFFDTTSPSGAMWRRARALFTDPGPLADAIRAYWDVKDGTDFDRMQKLPPIGELLQFPWDSTHLQSYLGMLLLRDAAKNTLTIDESRTFRDWLASIVANELERKTAQQEPTAPNISAYPIEFDRFMAGATISAFELTFENIGVGMDFGKWIHAAAVGFSIEVVKKTAPAGHKGHFPEESDFKSTSSNMSFVGAMFELKGGWDDPPEMPEKAVLYTGDTLEPIDFEGAYFELYAMDAGVSGGLGLESPLMSIGVKADSGGSSQLLRLHVKGRVYEVPCDEGHLKPKVSYDHTIKIDREKIEKIVSRHGIARDKDFVSPSNNFFKPSAGVSVALGTIVKHVGSLASWMQPPAPVRTSWDEVADGDGRSVAACFGVDSAALLTDVNGWEARLLFEIVLATEMVLLNGVPKIKIEGSASPEYTPQHNKRLSADRASQLAMAIVDACPGVPKELIESVGLGDLLALQDAAKRHLGDVEPDPFPDETDADHQRHFATRAEYEKNHPDLVAKWPQYRRADVHIRGKFAIRVFTVADEEG